MKKILKAQTQTYGLNMKGNFKIGISQLYNDLFSLASLKNTRRYIKKQRHQED